MSRNSPPPFRYRQPSMAQVEDVEKYAPGGYHPVDIGDIINTGEKEYKVIHKLGYGGFSTVWLVLSVAPSPTYYALKILCADAADVTVGELAILQYLETVASAGHSTVVSLHDSFKISGPNGEHQCLLFPALGPSLQDVDISRALSDSVRHHVCQQVAHAMSFLHQHGVCHGDFTASNVVFELPDIQSMSPDRVLKLLGPIMAERLRLPNHRCSPHAPKQVIQTPDFSGLDYSLLTRIRIIDFGQAFFADHPPKSLGVPIDFFPPELCFGYLPSTKSDVWQLACVLYQIHTKRFLFPTIFRIFEMLIGTAVSYLGPIPQHWQGKFDFDEYGYSEPGRERATTEPAWWFGDRQRKKTIDSRLNEEAKHLSLRQRQEFVLLLHDMVAYEPWKRPEAVDVIRRLRSATFSEEE